MNEQRFGKEIKGYLNQGLDLPAPQLAQLKAAREQALSRQRSARFNVVQFLPAAAGRATGPLGPLGEFGALGGQSVLVRWGLPLLIAAAAILGFQHWKTSAVEDHDPVAETMGIRGCSHRVSPRLAPPMSTEERPAGTSPIRSAAPSNRA